MLGVGMATPSTMRMTLAEATEAYQAMLEGHRAHPDNDELYEDLLKAKAQVEIAWLRRVGEGPR